MPTNMDSWLRLGAAPGIGPVLFRRLVKYFGSPERVLAASVEELCSFPNVDRSRAAAIKKVAQAPPIRGRTALLEKLGDGPLIYQDPAYPKRLLTIYDYPPVLYVRGQLADCDELAIAIVGSRRASPYGLKMAERFSAELVRRGFTVVSGLARGIDSAAHRAALGSGGRTIAVLGSGIDVIYPAENRRLADQIAARGAVVSEFPLGTKPEAGHFPRRNRIISGVSLGVLVIEAGARSGALLTARYAADQGREVFALPGSVDQPGSRGTHRLIQEGAKLVEDVEDILEELPPTGARKQEPGSSRPREDLSEDESKLLSLLTDQPAPVDDLISRSGLLPSQVLAVLFSLEMKGLAQQFSGKQFIRK